MPAHVKENLMYDVAIIQNDDGWGDAAAESGEYIIKGSLLKFADWKWTKGKESIEVKHGTAFVALGTTAAWVKWSGGKPIEYKVRQAGHRLPDRDELGDLEEGDWELGPDNKPKDPWANTRFIYFVDPTSAQAYTFSTSSWGGRQAVNDLAEQIQRARFGKPGTSPLVELQSEPWLTKFGRKSKPFFKVIDWRGGEPRNGGPTPAMVEGSTVRSIDEEVPF
jgi:hypothetical protein